MAERALKCPQCNGPLAPSRFAKTLTCPYCGSTVVLDEPEVVSAERFHRAYREWNAPATHGFESWVRVGDAHWAIERLIAPGETSDVYAVRRARWPTQRALLKILRSDRDAALFDHEWEVLDGLEAAGGSRMSGRIPRPLARGVARDGDHAGPRAMVLDRADGFDHTFEAVRRVYPEGVEPRASIWIWRRILETLAFLHRSRTIHGAVLPQHLLIETGEHGVRLVGFSAAGPPGALPRTVCGRFEALYPGGRSGPQKLSLATDLSMSARSIAFVLGGDPASGEVPEAVPERLAELVRLTCASRPDTVDADGAWQLREALGRLASELYGPPAFCPLSLPEET
jgi:hypothetical protein